MLTHAGTYLGAQMALPIGAAEIVTSGSGASFRLNVVDYGNGATTKFSALAGAIGTVQGQDDHVSGRTALVAATFSGSVLTTALNAVLDSGAGASITAFLSFGAEFFDQVELVSVSAGADRYLFAAASDGAGFSVFTAPAGGGLIHLSDIADTAGAYAEGISAMAAVQIGTKSFIYVGSVTEDGVTGYEVGAGGAITEVAAIGTGQLIPTESVTDMAVTTVAGESYLVVASAETSSLTVFAIASDGKLMPVNHVVDDLGTRFQSASVMDVVSTGGRTYVVVAGADDGLTLLTLLPGGQLLHVQTLSDTAAMSLAHVSAIKIVPMGNELQVFVTSGLEAGMTLLRVDLSNEGVTLTGAGPTLTGTAKDDILVQLSGDATLSGGAGADILRDGTGSDHLLGGSGADTFVLIEDGVDDVIMDFEWGKDRIDLSCWSYLRNVDELVVTPTATGATIRYGQEFLTILTSDGRSLLAQDFTTAGLLNITRFPVASGAPQKVCHGTTGAETLVGTAEDELFVGLEGDDVFVGGGGDDQFDGGLGFDLVDFTGTGSALSIDFSFVYYTGGPTPRFRSIEGILGTSADDTIRLDGAANLLDGKDGNDLLDGRSGDDTIRGGSGADTLIGQDGNDSLDGGDGDDLLSGGDGNDTLMGGLGQDTLHGDSGSDWVSYASHVFPAGGPGVTVKLGAGTAVDGFGVTDELDSIENARGSAASDTLIGTRDDNRLEGLAGNDTLRGARGDDLLDGGGGDDRLVGDRGADTLAGGAGNDRLHGKKAGDVVYGGDGDDYISGATGKDRLYGGADDDVVRGGAGNDRLEGGQGNDTLVGGGGADVFVFAQMTPGEIDLITDFRDGADMIQLAGIAGGSQAARFAALDLSKVPGGVAIEYDGHVIILDGVGIKDVDKGDFIFV